MQDLTSGSPSEAPAPSDEPGVEAVAGDTAPGTGSTAAAVAERLRGILPEKLRPGLDSGRELAELVNDFRRLSPEEQRQVLREGGEKAESAVRKIKNLSPEEQRQLLREGEEKAESAFRKIKSKVSEAKDGLAADDSAARKIADKLRQAVGAGSAAFTAVSAGEEASAAIPCDGGAVAQTDTDATDADAANGIRALRKRVKAAVKGEAGSEVGGDVQRTGRTCASVPPPAAPAAPAAANSSAAAAEQQPSERVPSDAKAEGAAAVGDARGVSVVSMLPTWLMFW